MTMTTKQENDGDILVVQANEGGGHDHIIADLHGNLPCLESVLAALNTNDRLFLTGDLIDRGKNSPGVMAAILWFQQKNPGKLYAVRGNHESLCLNAITGLEKLILSPVAGSARHEQQDHVARTIQEITTLNYSSLSAQYGDKAANDVLLHIVNGGEWLLKLFVQEWESAYIKTRPNRQVSYTEQSQIKTISDFIASLPYIITVVGDKPFNAVHADMPLDDNALQKRIAQHRLYLSEEEKEYATWARPSNDSARSAHVIRDTGRNAASSITYVGHTIVVGGLAPVVRASTNTVDLDVAAYAYDVSLVVDHTAKTCGYIGPGAEKAKNNSNLIRVLNELTHYLHSQR